MGTGPRIDRRGSNPETPLRRTCSRVSTLLTPKRFTRSQRLSRSRPRAREPAGRHVHQRPAVAQRGPVENRRDGRGRREAQQHIQTAQSVARVRVQDTQQVPRDGQHSAGHSQQRSRASKKHVQRSNVLTLKRKNKKNGRIRRARSRILYTKSP